MAKQTLIWTALPNGFDANGDLRISALVSPRLEPDADQVLKPFGDFLDWPATVRGAEFTLKYGNSTQVIPGNQTSGPARVDTTVDAAETATWTELLHDDTPVLGFKPRNLTGISVLSYNTVALNSMARVLYSNLAKAASDNLPKVSQILADLRWQRLIDAVAFIDRVFVDEKTGLRDTPRQFEQFEAGQLTFPDSIATLLAHVQLFHTPASAPESQDYSGSSLPADDPRLLSKTAWRTFKRTALPVPTDFAKTVDFHKIVAAMSWYPRLLRRLGLVVDFVVPRAQFAPNTDAALSITCSIPSGAGAVERLSCSNTTHVRLSGTQFVAVSKSAPGPDDLHVVDGLLHLNPEQFAILQADVDATGLKLMNFARTLGKMLGALPLQSDAVTKHEKEAGAPALRNAGLMLVHRRRANMLKGTFVATQQKEVALANVVQNPQNPQPAPPDLFAEDVVRGWRVDIWDDVSGKWRSACERTSTHTIGSVTVHDDREGFLRLAATKSADGSNPNVLYLHEALMSWTGWSLVAPQPGRVVDKSDKVSDGDVEVPPGLPMKSVFKAHSLPRLRYGRSYRLRARMVDLAANSLLPSEHDFGPAQPATSAVKYWRFEPLQAPSLAIVRDNGSEEKPLEGETMDRIAIRTLNATPADNVIPTTQTARRFAVPARSSVREAELHGMFDSGGHVDGSAGMYALLASKDAPLGEVALATPGPLDTAATVNTVYAVLDAPAESIPYLPDPLCVEMAARILDHPGFPSSNVIAIPAYKGGKWPNAAPFTIRVFEDATATPKFEVDTRVLQVPLPKAVRAKLLLSCKLLDPALMGIWNWLPDADRASVAAQADVGRHWALTPWRTVEIVHAVQKPLIAPEMKLALSRGLGSTSVAPRFTASCSLASTARVDLQAAWHEPDIAAADPMGADLARDDHAFSVKITDPLLYRTKLDDPQAGGFPEHEIAGTDMITVGGNDLTGTRRHEFNDTRYRRIEYWLEATTRFREYMTTDILTKPVGDDRIPIDDHIKVIGPRVRTWVRSSAPPPAPGVLYVVPTFGWTTQKDAEGHQSRWRRGGGLRVYLDRPWNVTGYGEMLAVVLPRTSFTDDPNTKPEKKPYKKFVTQWGNDPVWESPFVAGCTPAATNFPLARRQPDPAGEWLPAFAPKDEADQPPGPFQCTSLPHPSVNLYDTTVQVDVAPHDVSWDPVRHLWYCDVDVNFGAAYFPFVRLALARYQPVSETGAHLSPIVLADFMSLTPDRWLSITRKPDPKAHSVTLYGHGYSNSSGHREAQSAPSTPSPLPGVRPEKPTSVAAQSIVEVWVERLEPSRGVDFGWTREAGAAVTTAVEFHRCSRSRRRPPDATSNGRSRPGQASRR